MILAVLFDFTRRVRPFSACFCLFDASGQLLLVHSIIGLPNLCSVNVSLLQIVVRGCMFLLLPVVGLCIFGCAILTSEGSWTLSPVYVCLPKAVKL